MHPVLFELPWGDANAYGTFILLGGTLALLGIYWDARDRALGAGRPGTFVLDFYLVLIFGAAIGGRVLHVLTVPTRYLEDPSQLWSTGNAGFVFFGSLLFVVAGWAVLARRHRIRLATICDLGATWMGLGHAFGRVGCFLAGCCWGAPTNSGWGSSFPPESVVAQHQLFVGAPSATAALHPTQLYEAIGLAILLCALVWIRVRNGIESPWRQTSRYAIGYGVLRFCTEIFRADERGHLLRMEWPDLAGLLDLPAQQPLVLSISQALALALIVAGGYGLRRSRRREAASKGPGE